MIASPGHAGLNFEISPRRADSGAVAGENLLECAARAGFTVCGRRDGRVAEGDGLLNRYTAKSRIGGSNPPLSAIFAFMTKSENG